MQHACEHTLASSDRYCSPVFCQLSTPASRMRSSRSGEGALGSLVCCGGCQALAPLLLAPLLLAACRWEPRRSARLQPGL